MDCTVDSILTTTPFFSPIEGCEPIPIMSTLPSGVISPTIATTLEVPISRPTIKFLSGLLDIEHLSPYVNPFSINQFTKIPYIHTDLQPTVIPLVYLRST